MPTIGEVREFCAVRAPSLLAAFDEEVVALQDGNSDD
jgi:hypothetical protein